MNLDAFASGIEAPPFNKFCNAVLYSVLPMQSVPADHREGASSAIKNYYFWKDRRQHSSTSRECGGMTSGLV
uniref:Uncharacterized protein n=1 Tax=Ditylenchus dipsaci TaxID=166011 RepID=A0A915E3X9_9BILA